MLSHSPSNTIDFDAAKLQRLGFSSNRTHPLQPISLAQLRQQLNLQLQTSLEADQILELFFREVQCLVPLDALVYRHPSSDVHVELGNPATHCAGYRLNHAGEYLGELLLRRNERFDEYELAQLESLLASLVFPLRNALLYRSALQSALRDPLTDTGNRIAMDQALQREVALAERTKQPLAVLMLDLDHFKSINDRFGHSVGDDVLKAVASQLTDQLRNIDRIFRYGGEEFLILLSSTQHDAAALVGERLRQAILELHCMAQGQAIELSASFGGACLQPGESVQSLLRRADEALYAAKHQGRNRLTMAR
ncbi:MAG: GGDEF domain-containing protein [Pseudomonas sp.]